MKIAIWIIAICEVVRLIQNTMQLKLSQAHLDFDRDYQAMMEEAGAKIDEMLDGMMWTCPECGLEVHSDFGKCPRCGAERRGDSDE